MSEELNRKLLAVCEAEKNVTMPGGQARLDRMWDEYIDLRDALEKERSFGHPEDIPPMIVRTGISVDDSGIAHDVYTRRA